MVEETGNRLTHTELMLAEEFGVTPEQTKATLQICSRTWN